MLELYLKSPEAQLVDGFKKIKLENFKIMMEIDFDNLNKNQSNLLNQVYVNNKKDYVDFLKKNHFQDNIYLLSNFFSKDIYSNLSYIGFCQIKFLV